MQENFIQNLQKYWIVMDTSYKIKLDVTLRPEWHIDPPEVRIGVDQGPFYTELLHDKKTFQFEYNACNTSQLCIWFLNKNINDTVVNTGHDKLVHIDNISFFGISNKKFIWTGIYYPDYPEPWKSQQIAKKNNLNDKLTGVDCLAWNGKYTLQFDVPVFTWIHQIQNFGWLYK